MSTVKNNSSFLPRIIERTHLKLILRSPGLLLPIPTFFVIFVRVSCLAVTSVGGMILGIVGYSVGYLNDTSFECHREKSMQVNCLVQDSRLFNLIQLEPKYFNNIKEAKLGSEEVTVSTENGRSFTYIEYYLRLMDNGDRLSDSVFQSTDSNRIESIKNQINSFINSQQSSLDDPFTTGEVERTLNDADVLISALFVWGGLLLIPWLLWKLCELYTAIISHLIGHYFVFDKYAGKLDHTVKIFNWSLRSQCYQLSDITEVCLKEKITVTEGGKISNYTLRLLLNSYKRSGSQKNIWLVKTDFWLVKTDFWHNTSIENLSEIQKVISNFLSVNSTNK